MVVRPESVRLTRAEAGDDAGGRSGELAGKRGTVLTSVFYGDHVEYSVETAHGTLVCVESDPEAEDIHTEGDDVEIGVEARRAWALPAGDEEAGRWYVYHRAGRPCLRCGTPVRERKVGGRRLFWCPTCQAR